MNPSLNHMQSMTRRHLFQQVGMGMGGAALGSLLAEDLGAAVENGGLHFAPKAKRQLLDLARPPAILKARRGQIRWCGSVGGL